MIVWAVVPLTLSALYFLGGLRASRERKKDGGLGWLLIISAVAPMAVLASGKSWIYDGERLFMPTFPFLAALAGMGFGWIAHGIRKLAGHLQRSARLQRLQRVPWTASLAGVASLVVFLPPLLSIHSFYPHLLSYYSENIGGLPNATRLVRDDLLV